MNGDIEITDAGHPLLPRARDRVVPASTASPRSSRCTRESRAPRRLVPPIRGPGSRARGRQDDQPAEPAGEVSDSNVA